MIETMDAKNTKMTTPKNAVEMFLKKYELAGFSLRNLSVEKNKDGEYKKQPKFYYIQSKDKKEGAEYKWGLDMNDAKPGVLLSKQKNETAFGIITGKRSNGVIGIDCDSEDAEDTLLALYPVLNDTLSIKTKKGKHFYVKVPHSQEMLNNTTGLKDIHPSIDIRGEGGFLFSPYTSYESEDGEYKGEYTIFTKKPILNIPNELYETILKHQKGTECYSGAGQSNIRFFEPMEETTEKEEGKETPDPIPVSPIEKPSAFTPKSKPPEKHFIQRETPIELLRELLKLLPEDYTEGRDNYLKIITLVKHETKGSEEGFKLALETCRRPVMWKNEPEHNYRATWNSLKQTKITIGSLRFILYGLGHSKEEIQSIVRRHSPHLGDNKEFLNVVWFSTEENIASYLCNEWRGMFVYCRKTGWWSLQKNNTWKNTKEPDFIRTLTIKAFYEWIDYYLVEELKKPEPTDEPTEETMEEEIGINAEQNPEFVKNLKLLKRALGTNKIYSGIEAFLKEKMSIEDLDKKLDSNLNLFPFNNCVYDTDTETFREISPYDYITHTTGYDYKPYDEDTLTMLDNKLKEMITPEFYDFVLGIQSTCLNGNRRCPIIGAFTGVGANGKTTLSTLMRSIFGEMFSNEPLGLFTQKTISPRNPELLTLRGKRMVVIEEPQAEATLSSLIKMLEGAYLKVRDNYAKSNEFIEFLATFGLFMFFNNPPKFSGDGGVRRRVKAVPFRMRYVDKPTQENELKGDPLLREKFKNDPLWRNAGFELLRRRYKQYKDEGYKITIPEGIEETSNEVIDAQNPVLDWFNQYYVKTGNNTDLVKRNDLYNHYKSSGGLMSVVKFSTMIGELNIMTKSSNGIRSWIGIKPREPEPEPEPECDIAEEL